MERVHTAEGVWSMSYVSFLPVVLLVIFFVVFATISPRIDRQRRRVWLAFAAGYLVHAVLASLIKWYSGTP